MHESCLFCNTGKGPLQHFGLRWQMCRSTNRLEAQGRAETGPLPALEAVLRGLEPSRQSPSQAAW